MKIGIGLKKNSYTPEAFAYELYLKKQGFHVQLAPESELCLDNDLNIYFMGFHPFWSSRVTRCKIIHEYQSLSTPPHANFKNWLKRNINSTPSGRVFLNSVVEHKLDFRDALPSIRRDMGVEDSLFLEPSANPEFDLVYCGSIHGRSGLMEEVERLSKAGLKILMIGAVDPEISERFSNNKHVMFTGRVDRSTLPSLYRKAKAGLNYTPDIFPFNIQTSTKTLEYLAAGLGLVSNNYHWIREFSRYHGFLPLWVEDVSTKDDLYLYEFQSIDMSNFKWDAILGAAKFGEFLNCIYES